jgi:protein-tyrosine phosphatase
VRTPAPPLPGWLNLRDLGGLATAAGDQLRPGVLWRSENPVLTHLQLQHSIATLGLTRVVDLRSRAEVAHACHDWTALGIDHVRAPLSAGAASSWHDRYTSYVENRPANVVSALRAVMDADGAPVLVHCAAGKDRTGVVVALVLSLLGVRRSDIVDDYVRTAPAVEAILRRLEAAGVPGVVSTPEFIAAQQPTADIMEAFLDWLEERGGAETWVLDQGVSPVSLARFRASVLVA